MELGAPGGFVREVAFPLGVVMPTPGVSKSKEMVLRGLKGYMARREWILLNLRPGSPGEYVPGLLEIRESFSKLFIFMFSNMFTFSMMSVPLSLLFFSVSLLFSGGVHFPSTKQSALFPL